MRIFKNNSVETAVFKSTILKNNIQNCKLIPYENQERRLQALPTLVQSEVPAPATVQFAPQHGGH